MFGEDDLGQATPEQDGPAYEAPADPYAIEAAVLPSGVKVEFRSMLTLSAANLRWLRGADDREGSMAFYNEVQARGIDLLVERWDLVSATGRPVAVPRDAKGSETRAYLKTMGLFDLKALEEHLKGPMDRLLGKDGLDSGGPGE